jgi:hypothetical protein
MQGLNAMQVVKFRPSIAKPACLDHVPHRPKQRVIALTQVESRSLHSWTPFSTAASSSLTFTKIEPPSL